MSPNQFFSYIAHVKHTTQEILDIQIDITQRGFPCLRSNQVEENYTDPKELSQSRAESLHPCLNRFFFFFPDLSWEDSVGLVELGLAIGYGTEHICVIGKSRTCSWHYHPRIQYYDDWDNFLFRHFPAETIV